MSAANMMFPQTSLRRPYVGATGALVPQEEGIRRASKTVYVDQAAGNDANNGRSWAAAKASIFGAAGAITVLADGDTCVIRAGHAENIAAATVLALNFVRFVAEGTGDSAHRHEPPAVFSAGISFVGVGTLTLTGNGTQWHRLQFNIAGAADLTITGNMHHFYECAFTGLAPLVITAAHCFFRGCYFPAGFDCSSNANTFLWPINGIVAGGAGVMAFTAAAAQNLVVSPRNLDAPGSITFAAGTFSNDVFDVPYGAQSFTTTDAGAVAGQQNRVRGRQDSSTLLVEVVEPDVPTAANLVTGAAGAGVYGVLVPIGPVAIVTDYEFLGIVAVLNQVDVYSIEVQDSNGRVLGEFVLDCAVAATRFNEKLSTPVRVRGGVGIQARLKTTGGGADTAGVRVKIRA